jgi:hypothetical protein
VRDTNLVAIPQCGSGPNLAARRRSRPKRSPPRIVEGTRKQFSNKEMRILTLKIAWTPRNAELQRQSIVGALPCVSQSYKAMKMMNRALGVRSQMACRDIDSAKTGKGCRAWPDGKTWCRSRIVALGQEFEAVFRRFSSFFFLANNLLSHLWWRIYLQLLRKSNRASSLPPLIQTPQI